MLASLLLVVPVLATGPVCAAHPSTFPGVSQEKPNDPIQSIRKQFITINNGLKRYKLVKKSLSGFSTEGGELKAYLDGRPIVKMVATYFGESGRSVEEYYYWDGKLIFVFRKQMTYDQPLSGKVARTEESRFYFQSLKLIKWINNEGKEVPPTDPEFSTQQQDYLNSSQLFLKGARGKAATIEADN